MAKEEKKEESKKEVQEVKKEEKKEEKPEEPAMEFMPANIESIFKDFKLVAAKELLSKGFKKDEVISYLKIVEAFLYYLEDHNFVIGSIEHKKGLIDNIDNILKEIMNS